ncbi:serine/threonine protein kinase [Psychrobacillus antarcticus]|uniref:serine/threonine protein kinase n=1 Tax=Psychrobacillus antarcticus TaxID=2879115 RepID=UPI00240826B2|nr:protein kinase [Psychrobacillus antarcticus]
MRSIRKLHQFFVDKPVDNGTIINNLYRVSHVIGSGSYGIIYYCKDIQTNEIRVLKQLRPSKHRTKSEVALFENEISIISRLQHPSMPQLYEYFSVNGSLFYSMNYIEGINMEELIFSTNKTFNEKESLAFIFNLLPLIDHIHKRNIYHGDIRISNILINKDKLYLIDFGLSKIEQNDSKFLEIRQGDYYDLGDILLYLLYTTYSSKNKKALPWTEELTLEQETVHLLKRLLQINEAYPTIESIAKDVEAALLANTKENQA